MNLTNIFNLGDDQLKAHFNIIFPIGIPFGTSAESLVLRAKGFKIPDSKLNVYDVPFHGLKLQKTSNQDEAKTFNLEIRMAKDWKEYKDLKRWLDYGYGYNDAGRLEDSLLRTTVIVQPTNIEQGGAETVVRNPIKFNLVKITGISGVEFSHDANDPIMFTCDFIYVTKDDVPYL
jgi:hypothetical protein